MKTYKTHNKCLKSSFASVNAKKKKKKTILEENVRENHHYGVMTVRTKNVILQYDNKKLVRDVNEISFALFFLTT